MTAIWGGEDGSSSRRASIALHPDAASDLVGESQAFLNALSGLRRMISEGAPIILLRGESGTGKTVFARSIHYRGAAPSDPFLTVQCSLLPAELIEPELFGAPAGSLPGQTERKPGILELAGRGTVFLDDVQLLPPELQSRLLALLTEGHGHHSLHCRVLAASRNWPPPEGSQEPMQPDFHVLLMEHAVELPPLRKRERDLELLVTHFLERWAGERGLPVPEVDPDAIAALYAHPWPGNVRELRTTVERAARLSSGGRIRLEHLQIQTREHRGLAGRTEPAADMIVLPATGKPLDEIEREAVRATLGLAGGNRDLAAEMLRISRATLDEKLTRHGIE
jgi:DNA-binding NtrC family response regulator